MKRSLQLIAILSLIIVSSAYGQVDTTDRGEPPIDGYIGLVKKDKRAPMPLAELKPENISYSKRVWQNIDGRLRINRGITSPSNNLMGILLKHIKNGSITAYDPTPNVEKEDPNGDAFKTCLSSGEAVLRLTGKDSVLVEIFDENGEVTDQDWVNPEFDPTSVFLFRIKEDWIFDEQRSVFEPRIIGIAPLIFPKIDRGIGISMSMDLGEGIDDTKDPFVSNDSVASSSEYDAFSMDPQPAFWLYFPEIRNVLVNEFMPNDYNDAEGISYDDFFIGRHFDSYIVKVSNSRDLRIKDYKRTKTEQLLESERLKRELMNYQNDLYRN
ncbi:gliding motility protein GldN [Sphingobacterium kitahiroshimense]|uniref:gliding motility protein GldN n=1 Tax=Sphingobacterium kitahiroshimense TaxID=470446 RepID=UPI003208BD07